MDKDRKNVLIDPDLIGQCQVLIEKTSFIKNFSDLAETALKSFFLYPTARKFDERYSLRAEFDTKQKTVYIDSELVSVLNVYMAKEWKQINFSRLLNLSLFTLIEENKFRV